MRFRKILALLLCAVMGIGLTAGCGDGASMDFGGIFTTEEEISPYPLDTKVIFIYDGLVGTNTLIAHFEIGRSELERTLGAETAYIEDVRLVQFSDAVEKAVEEGANIIVAASSQFNSRVAMLVRDYPDILFINFGGHDQAPNLASIQPLLFQPAHVLGFVAAYNTYTNRIGIVADNNLYNAYGVVNAFALGVRELQHSQIELSLNWALSAHLSDTRRAVLDLVAQGCDIIFVYQSEEYATRLSEELGIKVISFAYNVPELAPDYFLSGMYMNFNTYLIDKVRKYMYGNVPAFGDLTRRGLAHGTVEMTWLNEDIMKQDTRILADKMRELVIDGRSTIFNGEIRDKSDNVRVEKGAYLQTGQIFAIGWLASNITVEKNFTEPITELVFSDLTIKR
jgi:basic membrane lipoprotein Med (substrate-binding protein (PBP1-ABC) superfamily)